MPNTRRVHDTQTSMKSHLILFMTIDIISELHSSYSVNLNVHFKWKTTRIAERNTPYVSHSISWHFVRSKLKPSGPGCLTDNHDYLSRYDVVGDSHRNWFDSQWVNTIDVHIHSNGYKLSSLPKKLDSLNTNNTVCTASTSLYKNSETFRMFETL